ncbi:hypothetical protein D5086_025575 [Populus alba]|uniref:Uncharacterized protein n=1 Tax=Populus alba TaxID=43335 RepID=A0ACC4B0B0_POPAL
MASSLSFLSQPRIRPVTKRPPNPSSSFLELLSVSSNSLQVTKNKDLAVVSRAYQREIAGVQGENLVRPDFERLCKEGKVEAALEIMDEKERNGGYADLLDIVKLIQVCSDLKLLEAGKKVDEYVMRSSSKFKSSVVVLNNLVEMHCKLGDTNGAREIFEQMGVRNLDSWNKMLFGLAENKEGEKALEIFSQMKGDGIRPDGSSFVGVLMACKYSKARTQGQLGYPVSPPGLKLGDMKRAKDNINTNHRRVTSDRSKAYEKLRSLSKEVRDAGYVPDTRLETVPVGITGRLPNLHNIYSMIWRWQTGFALAKRSIMLLHNGPLHVIDSNRDSACISKVINMIITWVTTTWLSFSWHCSALQ